MFICGMENYYSPDDKITLYYITYLIKIGKVERDVVMGLHRIGRRDHPNLIDNLEVKMAIEDDTGSMVRFYNIGYDRAHRKYNIIDLLKIK